MPFQKKRIFYIDNNKNKIHFVPVHQIDLSSVPMFMLGTYLLQVFISISILIKQEFLFKKIIFIRILEKS